MSEEEGADQGQPQVPSASDNAPLLEEGNVVPKIALTIVNQASVPNNERRNSEGVTVEVYGNRTLRDAIFQYIGTHVEGNSLDAYRMVALDVDGNYLNMRCKLRRLTKGSPSMTIYLLRTPGGVLNNFYVEVNRRFDDACGVSDDRYMKFAMIPIVLACTLLSGLLIYAFILLAKSHHAGQAVLIDAGSSHTFVSKYSLYPPYGNVTQIIQEDYGCEMSVEGISSFADQPNDVVHYLLDNECFQTTLSHVDSLNKANTALVLGATGGIRTMQALRPEATSQILSNITRVFNHLGFSNKTQQIKVLSGTEESLFAWVSVNYWSGNIQEEGHLVGSLDWGGASTQITFPYDGLDFEDKKSVEVLNKSINVFTVSHECYGQSKALNRYFMGLVHQEYLRSGSLESVIRSPCHPRQIKPEVLSGSDLYGRCTEHKDESFNSAIKDNLSHNFTFVGVGNVSECQAQIDRQFDIKNCTGTYKNPKVCFDSDTVPKAPKGMRFYALSTYWYLVELFNLPSSEADTLGDLRMTADDFKKMSEKSCRSYDVEGIFQGWSLVRVHSACFRSLFMHKLLFDGYGFDSFDNITFANKINGNYVSWSLGYLLSISSQIKTQFVFGPHYKGALIYFGAVGIMLFGACLIHFCKHSHSKREMTWLRNVNPHRM